MGENEKQRPVLYVYSRQGCHLCEILIEDLLPLVRNRMAVEVLDIDADEALRAAYHERVPVVLFDGELLCEYQLDTSAIAGVLREIEAS